MPSWPKIPFLKIAITLLSHIESIKSKHDLQRLEFWPKLRNNLIHYLKNRHRATIKNKDISYKIIIMTFNNKRLIFRHSNIEFIMLLHVFRMAADLTYHSLMQVCRRICNLLKCLRANKYYFCENKSKKLCFVANNSCVITCISGKLTKMHMKQNSTHDGLKCLEPINSIFHNNTNPTDLKDWIMSQSRVVNQRDKVTNSKHSKIGKTAMPNECIKGLNSYNPLLHWLLREHKCSNLVAADVEHIFHAFFTLKLK